MKSVKLIATSYKAMTEIYTIRNLYVSHRHNDLTPDERYHLA